MYEKDLSPALLNVRLPGFFVAQAMNSAQAPDQINGMNADNFSGGRWDVPQ